MKKAKESDSSSFDACIEEWEGDGSRIKSATDSTFADRRFYSDLFEDRLPQK